MPYRGRMCRSVHSRCHSRHNDYAFIAQLSREALCCKQGIFACFPGSYDRYGSVNDHSPEELFPAPAVDYFGHAAQSPPVIRIVLTVEDGYGEYIVLLCYLAVFISCLKDHIPTAYHSVEFPACTLAQFRPVHLLEAVKNGKIPVVPDLLKVLKFIYGLEVQLRYHPYRRISVICTIIS